MEAIDFSNSYLTWRTDWLKVPSKTVSNKPHFTLNNARIPNDCRCKITEKSTGPVLIPDLNRDPDDLIGGFELAFSAFNTPDWTEFIIRAPTPLTDEIRVYHCSRPLRLDTWNQMVQL